MTAAVSPRPARSRRLVRAGACAALAWFATLGATARAETEAEVAGRLTDDRGRPIPNADLVLTDEGGRLRRTDITDGDGRFFLAVGAAGVRRLSIYTRRGARVAVVVLQVPPGGRLWLEAGDHGERTRITVRSSAAQLPWTSPGPGDLPALARGGDLRGALVSLPGTTPPAPPADGPILLGSDPAESRLRLDGFLLNDPVDGRAPWELPSALFASATPMFGMGPTALRQSGLAEVALASPRPLRGLEGGVTLSGGLGARAGEAQGTERPIGWSGGAFSRASVGGVRAGGGLRGHLALAPRQGPFEADPESVAAMRGRQGSSLPWLARAEGELAGLQLTTVGLGSFDRWSHGRTARIAPPRDPASLSRHFWLVGATARRPARTGPGELSLATGLLRSSRGTVFQGDQPARTTAYRFTTTGQASTDARLLGWHLLTMAAGLDASWADRPTREPSRQAGLPIVSARASSTTPWLAVDERYRPVPALDLQLGVRLEKSLFRGRAQPEGRTPLERAFATGLLIAPRAQACYVPGSGIGRICLMGGRFGAGLPLGPLLDLTAAPPVAVRAPAEDAALALGELRLGPVSFSVVALGRRKAHLAEDRFSPVSGMLELHEPRGARRQLRALGAAAALEGTRTRVGAGVLASRLRGNHVGFLDAGSGQLRPGGTAEWDSTAALVNRDGPLPFDRPFGGRITVEHHQPLGRFDLALLALGRWDAGTPLSALGRSPESGRGQAFLVQRGSLGRTDGTASLDLMVGVSSRVAGAKVSVILEGFNLTNHRPVVARDQIYTDAVVAPQPGAGQGDLDKLMDAQGNPLARRPGYGNPVAWAEPLMLRLGLAVEF